MGKLLALPTKNRWGFVVISKGKTRQLKVADKDWGTISNERLEGIKPIQ